MDPMGIYMTLQIPNILKKPHKNPKETDIPIRFLGLRTKPAMFFLAPSISGIYVGVEPKIGGFFPQDGWFHNGKPY